MGKGQNERKEKKSVTAATEFAGARYVVSRASHGKIECILTYTFLSLPVLYSDSSTGPPATLNGPRMPPNCPRQSLDMVGQRHKEEQRRTQRSGRSQERRWAVERVSTMRGSVGVKRGFYLQDGGYVLPLRVRRRARLLVPWSRWSETTRSPLPPDWWGIRAPCRDSEPSPCSGVRHLTRCIDPNDATVSAFYWQRIRFG